MSDLQSPIAVFDSGMGGISVLRELTRCMPQENYLFFGDSHNAPYGIKSTEEVRYLTVRAAEYFLSRDAKAIVVACNTATSAAIGTLRRRWPELPIIGLEPALKPAALAYPGGRVLVLATPLTLREEKFAALLEHYRSGAEILSLPAPELVEYVEQDQLDTPALADYLSQLLAPYRAQPVDAVVLGCTHFPFAQQQIQTALGYPVHFFDGGAGAARETRRLLARADALRAEGCHGSVVFENSQSGTLQLEISRRLFARELLPRKTH